MWVHTLPRMHSLHRENFCADNMVRYSNCNNTVSCTLEKNKFSTDYIMTFNVPSRVSDTLKNFLSTTYMLISDSQSNVHRKNNLHDFDANIVTFLYVTIVLLISSISLKQTFKFLYFSYCYTKKKKKKN